MYTPYTIQINIASGYWIIILKRWYSKHNQFMCEHRENERERNGTHSLEEEEKNNLNTLLFYCVSFFLSLSLLRSVFKAIDMFRSLPIVKITKSQAAYWIHIYTHTHSHSHTIKQLISTKDTLCEPHLRNHLLPFPFPFLSSWRLLQLPHTQSKARDCIPSFVSFVYRNPYWHDYWIISEYER